MTAKEKLASVKMYGRNVSEFLLPDQMEFIEIAMEEYAQQQVKNLNIPAVIKSVCLKCEGTGNIGFTKGQYVMCNDCRGAGQTVL